MSQGCARFPYFVKKSSERQILWSLCSVDFHTLTLQLPIQTPHFVAPELQIFVSSLENCQNFSKTSTPQLKFHSQVRGQECQALKSFKERRLFIRSVIILSMNRGFP